MNSQMIYKCNLLINIKYKENVKNLPKEDLKSIVGWRNPEQTKVQNDNKEVKLGSDQFNSNNNDYKLPSGELDYIKVLEPKKRTLKENYDNIIEIIEEIINEVSLGHWVDTAKKVLPNREFAAQTSKPENEREAQDRLSHAQQVSKFGDDLGNISNSLKYQANANKFLDKVKSDYAVRAMHHIKPEKEWDKQEIEQDIKDIDPVKGRKLKKEVKPLFQN